MAASYIDKREKARAMLVRKGADAVFKSRAKRGAYVPGAGVGDVSVITITGNGILTNFENSEIDGTKIQKTDLKFIFVPDENQAEIKIGMYLEWFGKEYDVIKPNPVSPTGDIILYNVQLRKSV